RQANALKQALADLKKAEKLDGNAMYRAVSTVIYRFVADKALLDDVSSWNQQTILDVFTEQGLKTGLKQQVIACLEQADSGLYAPTDATDQASLLKQAEKVLVALDAAWGQA